MGRVAELPCANCGAQPVHVHHIRAGQGMAQRASSWLTLPLCVACHTGRRGIHGDRTAFLPRKTDELQMLAETLAALYGG